jgi:WD40 repeat protein
VTRALLQDASGIGVHDLATGTQQYVIPTPPSYEGVSSGAFSPDGSRVVVATSSVNPKRAPGRVTVWDAAAGKKLTAIELPGYGAVAAALTFDGKHVVTAGQKPTEKEPGEFIVTAWEVATGAKKGELTEPGGFTPPHVAPAPDNKTAAVVTGRGKLVAFDLATGRFTKTYELARRPVLAPVFSPDGKKLALAGEREPAPTPSATILVLDWPSGEPKYKFTAPGGEPGVMVFSPDSKSLVTGLADTTAIVWDVSR